ncbi:MAG: GGDEF domain-containing protein [Francisellaceae bacterium]|jgi:diguanylate cyclase (GGDEF)-like protein|nr:GGDEF domain-containing protein [Francisellaceae bacterium]
MIEHGINNNHILYGKMLDLFVKLQSNLDIDETILVLYNFTCSQMPIAALNYLNNELKKDVMFGSKTNNVYRYDLELKELYLGSLELCSISPLNNTQVEELNTVVHTVLQTIKNSIDYSIAVSNSMIDHLTQVNNRNSLEQDLLHVISLKKRRESSSTLLLFDLDKFKQVNDQLGHLVGDELLVNISNMLKSVARESDIIYRYGGDEFVILLKETSLSGALQLAERIRESINCVLEQYNKKLKDSIVSVSVGLSEIGADDDVVSLFDRVDNALYRAKRDGGNQVVESKNSIIKPKDSHDKTA